jgi:histidyl-tRNA synthetase
MKPKVLKGFRDYGPEEMLVRQRMLDQVRHVFEAYGYLPLHTPALEYAEILLGKYGDEGEKLLYKFADQGGRMVALRYDLTVPLARYVGMNPNLRYPFRRYHIAPVWRAERPQKGRFREFYQCDVDLVGIDSPQADAECICIDCDVLSALGLDEFAVHVNHRGFLDGLLESLEIGGKLVVPVMRTLDKIDKVSNEALKEMLGQEGLSSHQVDVLAGLSAIDGDNQARLVGALKLANNHPKAAAAVERLRTVLEFVGEAMPEAPVHFSPAIARGLDYYTGIVYETFLPARYGVGSVMSGGRYDDLLGTMANKEIPAVGISLGIDRLISALTAGGEAEKVEAIRVLVCAMKGTETEAFGLAARLRRELPPDVNQVELYPKAAKLKKQFEYANKKNIPYLIIIGPDEAASGEATLRNMQTGEQATLPLDALAEKIGLSGDGPSILPLPS